MASNNSDISAAFINRSVESSDDDKHSTIITTTMTAPEVYNLIALAGLLIGKAILLIIIIYYCCKKRAAGGTRNTSDSGDQTECGGVFSEDEPPTYKALTEDEKPPDFQLAILQEELSPENPENWKKDRVLRPEIREIITRSRHNSICASTTVIPPGIQQSDFRRNFHDSHYNSGSGATNSSGNMDNRTVGVFWVGM